MKYTFTFIIALVFISCSNSNDEEPMEPDSSSNEIEILEIIQKKVRIGDTIVINGNNLDKITSFKFKTIDDELENLSEIAPLEKSLEEIKVIVPTLNNELFELFIFQNNSLINSTSLNLIGTFPLKFNFNHDDVKSVKIVNDKTAFVAAGSKLYKTIDGGYDWELIKDFGYYIGSSMFFINESLGWVEIYDDWNSILYYTNDGGITFNKIFENNFAYKSIIQIYFSSPTNGYLLTTKGEIYQTDDNLNFDLIYDFPNSNEGSGYTEFFNLSVFNNTLVASGESGPNGNEPILIKKTGSIFNYSTFDKVINNVQLINDSKAYQIRKTSGFEDRLFFTNDISSNWEETSNKRIHDFFFTSKDKGIGVSSNINYGNHIIFETYDGGKNWINKFDFKDFEYTLDIDFYNNTGLITGYRGKIWKHIFE
ncbi:hypothetical protein ATO12_03635 [Aquimarina atlantica]|uniref:Photosynthesis system II assembly factor Ycf48/Hcf136-like domain-containing protein n=1 Tax=Aquimarina atlantica TaxID=1317122 RepID=A0A023C0V0_9FLAO|nr:hypothetical protein [Aquimarina atlantica]EZH75895.1 hypothetical protein ATO12_03635 [Aquimarina atlantica]